MFEWIGSMCTSSWVAAWHPPDSLRSHFPPRHSDFRDSLPDDFQAVVDAYAPYVAKKGRWTLGLCDMWSPKAKMVKHAVHIPCWDSFRLNPLAWRGICFGRTLTECYYTGLRQSRWARAAYAGAMSPEFFFPVQNVGHHGYKSDIQALCWLYCAMGCIFGCGIGQIFSLCGNIGCNFGACYSCHGRERLRRRFQLPPAFGMPPGIDDFLVHFFCLYCASHQEIREMALRGVDGPGMYILDVLPNSFQQAPGIEAVVSKRKSEVDTMLAHPPKMFISRMKKVAPAPASAPTAAEERPAATAPVPLAQPPTVVLPHAASISGSTEESNELGWAHHCCAEAPEQQMMQRDSERGVAMALRRSYSEEKMPIGVSASDNQEGNAELELAPRAWSVAY